MFLKALCESFEQGFFILFRIQLKKTLNCESLKHNQIPYENFNPNFFLIFGVFQYHFIRSKTLKKVHE